MNIPAYVECVLDEGNLDDEILHIRRLLVGLAKHPHPDRGVQAYKVHNMTAVFKALLSAKEAREKCVQQVRQDNRGNAENGSPSPADNSSGGVGVWNVLKQKVTGR